jgi:hypothetical protein
MCSGLLPWRNRAQDRLFQEIIGINTVLRSEREPDAGPDAGLMTIEIEWRGDGFDDPERKAGRGLTLIGTGAYDDRKLVATQACQDVALADRDFQPSSDLDQQQIPGVMPERVVDRLEFIQIEHHDGEFATIACVAFALVIEPFVEHRPVDQPGERVIARQSENLGLIAPPLGNILEGCDPAAVRHRLFQHTKRASGQ